MRDPLLVVDECVGEQVAREVHEATVGAWGGSAG
jgi:hypothetical protein